MSVVLQKVYISLFTPPSALRGEQLEAGGWCQPKKQVQPKQKQSIEKREKERGEHKTKQLLEKIFKSFLMDQHPQD